MVEVVSQVLKEISFSINLVNLEILKLFLFFVVVIVAGFFSEGKGGVRVE